MLAAGCGEDAGAQAFAGTERAVGPGGAYSFRYLSPPWAAIPTTTGLYAVVGWDLSFNLDLTKLPSLDSLPVVLRIEAAGASADSAIEARMVSLSIPSSQSRTLATRADVHGREIAWEDDSASPIVYWREGYFDGTALGGASYRMQFKGLRAIAEDPLVQGMLVSFGP